MGLHICILPGPGERCVFSKGMGQSREGRFFNSLVFIEKSSRFVTWREVENVNLTLKERGGGRMTPLQL